MMRRFHVQFNEKKLTSNAGLVHLGRFADKLKLPKILSQHISIERGATAGYQAADVVMMLALAVLAGAKHMRHMFIIRTDSALRALFKWEKFPDDTTIGRIFKLFTHRNCKELSEVEFTVRKKVWSKKWFGRITLDMDSTVRGVYGSQEGAEKGYNPGKRVKRAIIPFFALSLKTASAFIIGFVPAMLILLMAVWSL